MHRGLVSPSALGTRASRGKRLARARKVRGARGASIGAASALTFIKGTRPAWWFHFQRTLRMGTVLKNTPSEIAFAAMLGYGATPCVGLGALLIGSIRPYIGLRTGFYRSRLGLLSAGFLGNITPKASSIDAEWGLRGERERRNAPYGLRNSRMDPALSPPIGRRAKRSRVAAFRVSNSSGALRRCVRK